MMLPIGKSLCFLSGVGCFQSIANRLEGQSEKVVRCVRYGTEGLLLPNCSRIQGSPFARKKAAMENYRVEELRAELNQLFKQQTEVLESRSFGAATDTEILEYEIRQEIIHDICNELANSVAA